MEKEFLITPIKQGDLVLSKYVKMYIYKSCTQSVKQKTISLSSLSLDTDTFLEECHCNFLLVCGFLSFFGCVCVLFSFLLLQVLSYTSKAHTFQII